MNFLSLFFFFGLSTSVAPPTLRLVNLVYRHGDRSPVLIFPKDPNQVNSWINGLGWLTPLGMKEQYATGKFLRRRYEGFLNETYSHFEITVNSSDTDRCLMSAYSNLAGLYPPGGNEKWNPSIPWQPIPVHTRPAGEDNVLKLGVECPKYDQLYNQSLRSPEVKKEEAQNKAFYEFVANKSGVVHETIANIWEIADTLFCELQHNKTWASWVNQTIYDKLRNLEAWGFDLMYKGKEEARLMGGPLLKVFVDNMQSKVSGSLDAQTKMLMYSAHDSTVAALMSALQIFNKISPPYTATLMVELHEENGQYNVQIFYRNFTTTDVNSTREPVPLQLPGCNVKCPFNKFLSLTKDAIPVDWKAECSLGGGTKVTLNAATIIAMSVGAGIVLILFIIIVAMCCRQKQFRSNNGWYRSP